MKTSTHFGLKGIINEYTLKNFFIDSILPCIISLVFVFLFVYLNMDVYMIISKVSSIYLAVLPTLLALMIAAFTILISFFWSDKAKVILEQKTKSGKNIGKETLRSISASFSMATICISLTLVFSFIVYLSLDIPGYISSKSLVQLINALVLFFLIYLFLYIMKVIYDAVKDLYNISIVTIII